MMCVCVCTLIEGYMGEGKENESRHDSVELDLVSVYFPCSPKRPLTYAWGTHLFPLFLTTLCSRNPNPKP